MENRDSGKHLQGRVVFPGERLCPVNDQFIAGYGCQVVNENIHACVQGKAKIQNIHKDEERKLLIVSPSKVISFPAEKSTVFGQVISVNLNSCRVRILCVDYNPIENDSFLGTIQKRDVRERDIDNVRILESFVPGDVVKACVLAMGTRKICHLTTAKNDLGVVFARSKSGYPLRPLNEHTGVCTVTNAKEKRKFGFVKKYKKRKRRKRRN